jgi:type I restriction enzyme S subunit
MAHMIPFGDLVKEDNRLIEVLDTEEYACGGVRLHGKGVFIREYKLGHELKKKFVQHTVKAGDVVYSTLFAKSGAFAIADEDVEGVVLSEKFPTFRLISDAISLDYLKWFFRSGQLNRIAEEQMTGIAAFSLGHLSKSKFLMLRVPVPSPERQAEVVRLCQQTSEQVMKNLAPTQKNVELLEHLIGVSAEKVFAPMPRMKMKQIGDYMLRGVQIRDGDQYSQITVAMKHRGLRLRRICDGSEIKSPGQCSVEEGDLVFSRIDIRQGAIGFVGKDLEGGVVTRDFPVFRFRNTNEVCKQFARYAFMAPSFMNQAKDASRGTTGRKKMKRPAFLDLTIPWSSPEEQIQAVATLREIERNSATLALTYRKQGVLAGALGKAVIETLFARDAGLI